MEQYNPNQVDPLTGNPIMVQPQQTISPPIPSNQMGNAKPVFNALANNTANTLFGQNPQEGLKNPPMFQTEYNKYNNQQLT